MKTYISMLRGINVSGQKMIKMDALKMMYDGLGFKNSRTFIQSGNVVFESSNVKPSALEEKIQKEIAKTFGFEVPVIIRLKDEMQIAIKKNPFLKKDIDHLYVTFLSAEPSSIPLDELNKVGTEKEEFIISGKEIYLFYPNGYGRTKLTNAVFERKLRVTATTRNWKTVNSLVEIANGKSGI